MKQANARRDSRSNEPNWVQVDFVVTCKTCGTKGLAWQRSRSGGRWYLAETRKLPDGSFEADRRAFHNCPSRSGRQASDPLASTYITDEDTAQF